MRTSLIICFVIFFIILVLLKRLSSIKLLIRMLLNFAVIYGYIRIIVSGNPIIPFSILAGLVLIILNIFIKSGINRKSFSEVISVLLVTSITSVGIYVISKLTNIKLFKNEIMLFNGIKKSENAVLGLFIILGVGIFMDMISRIVFRLDEQKDKTADISLKEQFNKGIEIGNEFIIEKINMISLILLSVLVFPICNGINKGDKFVDILNQAEISFYFIIALIICIGLLISIPITSYFYALFNRKKTTYKTVSENKVDGKRSLKL